MNEVESRLELLLQKQEQRELSARRRALVLSAIPVMMAMLLLVFSFLQIQLAVRRVERIQNQLEKIQERWVLAEAKLKITEPVNGETVPSVVLLRGTTPFLNMNHYVVVTPVEAPTTWVQEPAARVDASGAWTGQAYIGTETSVGKRFIVRCLATESQLQPGPLEKMPENAVLSEPITVVRGEH